MRGRLTGRMPAGKSMTGPGARGGGGPSDDRNETDWAITTIRAASSGRAAETRAPIER